MELGHTFHVILELGLVVIAAIAAMISLDRFTVCKQQVNMLRMDHIYVALFCVPIAFLSAVHIGVAESGLAKSLSFFIPTTWFFQKLLISPLLLLIALRPSSAEHIKYLPIMLVGMFLGLVGIAIPADGQYYVTAGLFGRPWEFVPLMGDLLVGWYMWFVVLKERTIDYLDKATIAVIASNFFAQATMLFSWELFDLPFTVSHTFAMMAMIPMLWYAKWGADKNVTVVSG